MVRRNSGEFMLISNDVKNTRNGDLIICHSSLHQENLCTKSLKVENVVTVVSRLVNFVTSKGMSNRQFKNFMRDTNSEYGDDVYNNSNNEMYIENPRFHLGTVVSSFICSVFLNTPQYENINIQL
jgi:hypothetical protein